MLSVYVLTITLITLTATQLYISVIYFSLYTITVQKRQNNPVIVFMEAGAQALCKRDTAISSYSLDYSITETLAYNKCFDGAKCSH